MERIKDEVSERIIETAKALTEKKNGARITVRDILKEMNVSNRVFYNRFANIEEVLDALYGESVRIVRESLSIPWDGKSDFFGHINAVAARTLELSYDSRGGMSRLMYDMDFESGQNFLWWDREIRLLIGQGQGNGCIRTDLDVPAVSYAIWCFIRGFNADAIARGLTKKEARRRFSYGFNCLLAGIRA